MNMVRLPLLLATAALVATVGACSTSTPRAGSTPAGTASVAGPAGSATPSRPTPEQVDTAVRAVAARSGYGIFDVTDAQCRQSRGLDTGTVMPIASAFKLWILDALAREVAAGRAGWDETFAVRDDLRSDPSGEVYAMPAGTKLTLRRYAELMISISDNTAADHLLARLGRTTVEAAMAAVGVSTASRNTPLLSTADMARLKFVSPESGSRYLALGSVDERRRFLDRLPAEVPFPWARAGAATPDIDLSKPRRIDELEWFATPVDLCRTMVDLAGLAARSGLGAVGEILTINPGVPPDVRAQWAEVRFKGGSEPGVLTFVYWLARPDGKRRVVVLGWSDPSRTIAESAAGEAAFRAVLGLAHELG